VPSHVAPAGCRLLSFFDQYDRLEKEKKVSTVLCGLVSRQHEQQSVITYRLHMAKRKGLKNALVRQQVRQDEKTRTENYERRQADQLKLQGKGGSTSKTSAMKGKSKAKASSSQAKMVYQPYRDGESVLFVGEGNFSFAVSWAEKYPASAKLSFATSYDSEEDAERKYNDTSANVDKVSLLLYRIVCLATMLTFGHLD